MLIHKTFEGLAERGKCSMGWFFGFKLHLIINDKGKIFNFMFTLGNVDGREPLKQGRFWRTSKGNSVQTKDISDKAYSRIFSLMAYSLSLKRNSLMSIVDKILLRKRTLIETVNDGRVK